MESHRKLRSAFLSAACLYFVTVMATFSIAATRSPAKGHRVKITGPIVVREGDVVQILNWKDGSVHGFKVTDRHHNQMRPRVPSWQNSYGCLGIGASLDR